MEILLKRRFKGEFYTIGSIYIDNTYICDTLEDKDRGLSQDMTQEEISRKKVYGETAIPTGRYRVTLTYSPAFKRTLPLLSNVKGFSGIRIHSGNTNEDTLGCILVGENKVKGRVINSRYWENKIMERLKLAESYGTPIFITIS